MTSFLNKRFPELASQKTCIGCFACKDICTQNAIHKKLGQDGHYYVSVNNEDCIQCLQCEIVCKNARNYVGENDLAKSSPFAVWATDKVQRKRATSGGAFAAIANTVLMNGGSVVGAAFDGKNCKHIIIHDPEQLPLIQGSKYVQSSMEGVYCLIEEALARGDVLYSGLGCQCAAVLGYFKNKRKQKYCLYTVDLVCGGSPSNLLTKRFFEKNPDISQIVSFRTKDIYELKVVYQGVPVIYPDKSLPLHGFNCGMTNRYSCYDCQFAKAHRETDITIGDLWNYSLFPEQHKEGISTAIVHSVRGKELLNNSHVEKYPVSWGDVLIKNRRIVCGKQHIYFPRIHLSRNYEKMPYEKFFKLYCIAMKPKDITLFAFRIYRFVLSRYEAEKQKRYIYHLIEDYNRNRNQQ